MLPLVSLKCVNIPIRTCPASIAHSNAHVKLQPGTYLARPTSVLTPVQTVSDVRQTLQYKQNPSTKSFQRRITTQQAKNETKTTTLQQPATIHRPLTSFDGNEPADVSQIAAITPTQLELQTKSQSQRMEELVRRVFTPQLLDKLKTKHKLHERIAFRWQKTFKKYESFISQLSEYFTQETCN